MCANEDMSDICSYKNGAFEVSSNGQTGRDVGVLYKGDGMMFNQNIWHRGPRNYDEQFPMNRVMFIVTFISRRNYEKGDNRIQGMGTYYYQRWNMWGHTLEDLKTATKSMSLPWCAFKALGLWKSSSQRWGIPWLEHFARQLANDMDFYASYELPDFVKFLDAHHYPKWLRGTSQDWNTHLKEMFSKMYEFLREVHAAAVGIYVALHVACGSLVLMWTRKSALMSTTSSMIKRLLVCHWIISLLGWSLWHAIGRSDLVEKISTGKTKFGAPFPNATDIDLKTSALPERMDYLVGSRFDADFLGIYNHVLDYHPGNQRFEDLLDTYSNLPVPVVLQEFYHPISGVQSRFLHQDWSSGYWTLMDSAQIEKFCEEELQLVKNSVKRRMNQYLKSVLADSRFGPTRETAMTKHFVPLFVAQWQGAIFQRPVSFALPQRNRGRTLGPRNSLVVSLAKSNFSIRTNTILGQTQSSTLTKVGDRVYAEYNESGEYYEAIIDSIFPGDLAFVEYVSGGSDRLQANSLRRYRPVLQGDRIEGNIDGNWYLGVITKVHPLGTFDILYDDGDVDPYTPRHMFRLIDMEPVLLDSSNAITQKEEVPLYRVGQPIRANYEGGGQWFDGLISKINRDGTYVVHYDDGDKEAAVPPQFIKPP